MTKNREKPYVKRPLAMGTLFYILGLIGGELHYNIMQFSLFFIFITLGIIGLSVFYKNKGIMMYLIATLIGMMSIILNPVLKIEKTVSSYDGEHIKLEGKVLEIKEYEYQDQYIIKTTSKPITKVRVAAEKSLETAKQGDTITVYGKLDPLSFPRNPGAFNERSYLLIRGVTTKLKAEKLEIKIKNSKTPILTRAHSYYGEMFESIMPWDEAQIMKAMLLGEKVFLSKDIQELYKDAGIAHVLAISGLHISVIAGVLWWILRMIGLSKNSQHIVVLLILWIYAAFTGFSVSVTRSATMMSVIIIATLIEEKPDPVTSWSFAALVLLLYNNLYLWDIGFQLSFIAVGSLIFLTPFLGRIFIIPDHIRTYIAPTVAATLGTIPIIAYYYYVVTPISIMTNILLLSLITIVVIIGFLSMIIFPINRLLAKLVIGSSYYLLLLIEKVSETALKIPFSTIIIGRPDLLEFIIYIVLLGLMMWYLHLPLSQREKTRNYLISFCFLTVVFMVGRKRIPGELAITFLDVGQGDAIVITTPHHKTFTIDGGIAGSGKKIEQFLKFNGIQKVDGAILSHGHGDHMDGLGELAISYPIDQLFLSELPLEEEHFKAFYDIIKSRDIPIYTMGAQDVIKDKDVEIECIFPFKDLQHLAGNDASLVLVLRYDKVSYYFTGDIEENYEKRVSMDVKQNHINILKVPHHGSKTSSTQELIASVKPNAAIISCGKNNLYKHPNQEVLDRYEENNVPVQMTKDVGAIMTYSDGKKVKMHLMEDKRMLWQ